MAILTLTGELGSGRKVVGEALAALLSTGTLAGKTS